MNPEQRRSRLKRGQGQRYDEPGQALITQKLQRCKLTEVSSDGAHRAKHEGRADEEMVRERALEHRQTEPHPCKTFSNVAGLGSGECGALANHVSFQQIPCRVMLWKNKGSRAGVQ